MVSGFRLTTLVLALYPFEFTKKGAPSTNEETLTKVKAMVEEEFTARGLKIE
jgi:hypothetical protein